MNKFLKVLLHILFWVVSTWIVYLVFGQSQHMIQRIDGSNRVTVHRNPMELWHFGLGAFFKAIIVYLNLIIYFPRYTRDKNLVALILRIVISTAILIILELLSINYDILGLDSLLIYQTPRFPLSLMLYGFYIGTSLAYFFAKSWVRNERQKAVLVEEKLGAELDFLKAQVNPHFLFNTLNNLYSMASKSESLELAEGISKLSKLMRYMLYDSNSPKVPLQNEIDYIQSFIEIQKLRLSEEDDFLIHFDIQGETRNILLAPMLLIPFVENAFKHGISLKDSSIIKIELLIEQEQLVFSVFNSNYPSENGLEKGKSGIGLDNLRRRLELLYPGKYDLELKEDGEVHGAILKLNLD